MILELFFVTIDQELNLLVFLCKIIIEIIDLFN